MRREALQETKPQKWGTWGTALIPPGGDLELTWVPEKQRVSVAELVGMVTGLAGPFVPQDPFPLPRSPYLLAVQKCLQGWWLTWALFAR